MFVDVTGNGPPVVLLHGLGGSSYSWRHVTGPAAGPLGGRTRLALDLPGFGPHGLPGGASAPLPEAERDAAGLAAAVAAFIRQRGLVDPIVAGHSMGGSVALRLAELAAQPGAGFRIDRLILLAPVAFTPNGQAFTGALEAPDAKARARGILAAAYADPSAITQEQVDRYAAGLSTAHLPVFLAHALTLPRIEAPPPRFPAITAETLVVWGDEDRILPPGGGAGGPAARLVAALPNARLVRIPRCGHIPQEEKPLETNAAIAAFLA